MSDGARASEGGRADGREGKTCPECGEPVDDVRVTCPKCGREYTDDDYSDPDAGKEFVAGTAVDDEGNEIPDAMDDDEEQDDQRAAERDGGG
ncbi:MAG TPA: zinc-ribbon domain-containing protein [Actinomycetota bacterium]|nr:zinc-ribbon domain-containing protein [Actinomycetota bacterium]